MELFQDLGLIALLVVLIAFVTEAVTEDLVDSLPLEPVRKLLGKLGPWAAYYVTCGKCVSLWVSGIAALLFAQITSLGVAEMVVAWLLGRRFSNLWHDLLALFEKLKERIRKG